MRKRPRRRTADCGKGVAVDVATVRDDVPEGRDGVLEGAGEGRGGHNVFAEEDTAAGFEEAVYVTQDRGRVGHLAEHVAKDDPVVCPVTLQFAREASLHGDGEFGAASLDSLAQLFVEVCVGFKCNIFGDRGGGPYTILQIKARSAANIKHLARKVFHQLRLPAGELRVDAGHDGGEDVGNGFGADAFAEDQDCEGKGSSAGEHGEHQGGCVPWCSVDSQRSAG